MIEVTVILVLVFGVMLVLNVPIAASIALAAFLAILAVGGDPNYTVAMRLANGIDSFALLAIPFFILPANYMGRGGMARTLMDFASAVVGRLPGGLAQVSTMTCMLFGSISGSASAAVSSVGGFMIPEMRRKRYDNEFSVAVTTTAATTGLLIPPSNIMIVFASATGSVSIAALFMAGILPGIVVGLCIMAVASLIAVRRGYGAAEWVGWAQLWRSFRRAFLSLLLIIIVLGGILGGIFTATEAAAVAVAYALVLALFVYRQVRLRELPEILLQAGITTAVVMLLIGACSGLSWIMTTQNIPQNVSAALLNLSTNPVVILLTINLLLLVVGTFMDMTPAVLIFTPIFLPVVESFGMNPVHFGIVMIANLCIGLCTPPVGSCLFIGCGVGQTTIGKVTVAMLPFFAAMLLSLLLITYIPALSLWIPGLLGL